MESIDIHLVMLISPGPIRLSSHSPTLLTVHLTIKRKNLWSLLMDGIQLPQGCRATRVVSELKSVTFKRYECPKKFRKNEEEKKKIVAA